MQQSLSKSRLLSFRQCPKKLYLEIFHRELIKVTPDQQRIFNVGYEVNELTQSFYPGIILIGHDFELEKAVDETVTLLSNSSIETLFEATFNYKNVFIRADLLHKQANGFLIQEVKSSTSIKDVYIEDCAIQAWAIGGAGYNVDDIQLLYINNKFTYEEIGNYEGLFKHQSITTEVNDILPHVDRWVEDAFKILNSKSEPDILIGEQCNHPNPCPFKNYCNSVKTDYPVEILPSCTRTVIALRNEGIFDIRDIPVDRLNTENQERVRRVTISGKYELEPAARLEMLELDYPRYYIDFESINFAIPRWLGIWPYAQICFQWSCHIEKSNNDLSHLEFLDTSGDDPSRSFIETLIHAVGEHGTILVYNKTFENTRLKELAVRLPEYKEKIENIINRVVDLWPITKKYYYHPDMKGSWSIKDVLPTIAPELNYHKLEEVQSGGGAQDAYIEAIKEETTVQRKNDIRKNLIEYCKLDTLAMVKIAHFLEKENN